MKKGWFILFYLASAHAAIYTWTDSSGVVHFSDQSAPGAREIQLPATQTDVLSKKAEKPDESVKSGQDTATSSTAQNYAALAITDPQDQLTIRNPQGYVEVKVDVQPPLQAGHALQLLLDKTPVGPPQTSPLFSLTGLERGQHDLQVQVVDQKGQVMKDSHPIAVYMMQPRVGMGKAAP